MINRFRTERLLNKFLLLIVATFLLSNVNSLAVADTQSNIDTFQLPGGNVMQRTVYNPAEFAALSTSKATYQIVQGGNKLITFGAKLEFLSVQSITPTGGAWTYSKDGSVIGITGCTALAFGLDKCSSISNLVTGKVILSTPPENSIDPHELIMDDQGNYWFLSYPKINCINATQLCLTFNIPASKTFADCQVNELSPTGDLLFSWKASDHIPVSMIIGSYAQEGPRGKYVDLFHCNSIDLVSPNSVLLSSRNTNSIYLINLLTSAITWKFGGRYWPGVSLLTSGFGSKVGGEAIAQHDARSLGNDLFSFFDDNSHTNEASRGVVFRVSKSGNLQKAVMTQNFVNPKGLNSLCTGSARRSDLGNTIVGWGCSLNAITLFDALDNPIVSLDKIETPDTSSMFSHIPVIFNGVDWGPDFNYAMSYRVLPVFPH